MKTRRLGGGVKRKEITTSKQNGHSKKVQLKKKIRWGLKFGNCRRSQAPQPEWGREKKNLMENIPKASRLPTIPAGQGKRGRGTWWEPNQKKAQKKKKARRQNGLYEKRKMKIKKGEGKG